MHFHNVPSAQLVVLTIYRLTFGHGDSRTPRDSPALLAGDHQGRGVLELVTGAEHLLGEQLLAGVLVGRRRHTFLLGRPLGHTLVGALVVQQPEGGRPGRLVLGVAVTVT